MESWEAETETSRVPVCVSYLPVTVIKYHDSRATDIKKESTVVGRRGIKWQAWQYKQEAEDHIFRLKHRPEREVTLGETTVKTHP